MMLRHRSRIARLSSAGSPSARARARPCLRGEGRRGAGEGDARRGGARGTWARASPEIRVHSTAARKCRIHAPRLTQRRCLSMTATRHSTRAGGGAQW
eukprot:scaffold886_cov317-Prasinococcus_capsulatus_cf.AAC.7